MDGFEAGMGFQVDGTDANDEDLDNWNIAAKYEYAGAYCWISICIFT